MIDKYNNYFKNKKIIIVGPSSSLLNFKNGKFIDSFDVICRIKKSFPVDEKLEKYIGKKTNILVTHLKSTNRIKEGKNKFTYYQNNFQIKKPKHFNKLDYFYFPYPLVKQFLGFYDNFVMQFPQIKTEIIIPESNNNYFDIKKELNNYDPKIALMFIYDILKYDFKELYVTGLTFEADGFLNNYKTDKDFKNCNDRTNNLHNSNLEFDFFKKLLFQDKRIKVDKILSNLIYKKEKKFNLKKNFINNLRISLFYTTTNTINDDSVKNRSLIYSYNTLKKINKNTFLEKENINPNADISVMVSFFKKYCNKPQDNIRKEIYKKNTNTNWIFYDANPLAKFNHSNEECNEYLRISFDSPYHSKCKYLNGNNNRWNEIKKKYKIKEKPWRKNGKFILFILNSCKFCGYSVEDLDIFEWVNFKIKKIRNSGCKREIKIRFKCVGHNEIISQTNKQINFNHYNKNYSIIDPIGKLVTEKSNVKDGSNSLIKDLEQSWAVVLYSTTACLISLIYGVPVFSSSNSISYDLIKEDVDQIETLQLPDRKEFFNNFSGQIWSLEEMKNGKFSKEVINYYCKNLLESH